MPDQDTSRLDAERLDAKLEALGVGLHEAGAQLEQLNRLATLGTAAGMIAHEVRGLMTPVRAYAQLALRDMDDGATVRKALEHAERGARSAVQISETILEIVGGVTGDAVAQDSDQPETNTGTARVRDVMRAAMDVLEPTIEASGTRVVIEGGEDLAVAIGAVELQQVLVNLIENALRAMDSGGSVRLRAERSTWNTRDVVVIDVVDTGPGIDGEVASRAFQPFVTAGNRRAGSGVGLGLAVCQALVAHARGRISVDSARGAGARFRVTLPTAGA